MLGGVSRAEFLALDSRQEAAIAQLRIVNEARELLGLCTGTLIGSRTVLTAAHCVLPTADVEVSFAPHAGGAVTLLRVDAIEIHSELDVAILRLAGTPPVDVLPIPVAPVPVELAVGSRLQLGGFGASPSGPRRFAATEIAKLTASVFEVFSGGRSGACLGDSGGPALVRSPTGAAVAVGVLSGGSAGCDGTDTYVRIDAVRSWLTSAGAGAFPDHVLADCNLLGTSGRCFDNTVLWCVDGTVAAQRCGTHQACGYSTPDRGYRCVDPTSDPCDGLSALGLCVGNESYRCMDGRIDIEPCGVCGAVCRTSVASGAAACVPGSPGQRPE